MSKEVITTKVFSDSLEKLRKIQRIESYKQDKSLSVPEVVDMLADGYMKTSVGQEGGEIDLPSTTQTEK